MRTYPDNNIHGNGLEITTTRDGVNLEIRREKTGGGVLTCYMFVVADAVMAIINGNLIIPLPKQKYGNDMANVGPYLTHMWKWYGKVG